MFTIAADYSRRGLRAADTSHTPASVPYFEFPDLASLVLPDGCVLVGVERLENAIDLPSFHYPRCAAYVFGPERGSVSPDLRARCRYLVRIPAAFSVNLAVAGAIVMYDRLLSFGRFAPRPVGEGAPVEPAPQPAFGSPRFRRESAPYRTRPPQTQS